MSTYKNKNSLRTCTIEAQIVQKLKNNEARPKFTSSYLKKRLPKQSFDLTLTFPVFAVKVAGIRGSPIIVSLVIQCIVLQFVRKTIYIKTFKDSLMNLKLAMTS